MTSVHLYVTTYKIGFIIRLQKRNELEMRYRLENLVEEFPVYLSIREYSRRIPRQEADDPRSRRRAAVDTRRESASF